MLKIFKSILGVGGGGAVMPLILQSEIFKPGVELFGDRMVFANAESCILLAQWLQSFILPNLASEDRIKLDGSITKNPDGGTFHRADLAENYSVDREWLIEFISFLQRCGGFNTMG